MADAQNKKKGSAKGKKGKREKGSPPGRRSFFFRPATIILTVLTTLLLVLGTIYLARVQQWFSPGAPEEKRLTVKKPPFPVQEYPTLSDAGHESQKILPKKQSAQVAIIVDDLGADPEMMQNFLGLRLNLTAAILPNVPNARKVAEMAHAEGLEILLHMPMEPKNFPQADPGENALMVDLPEREVQERLRGYLRTVPWVVGANNHMGSRFTEHREGMIKVLQILKDQGVFFIDSRTSPESVAIAEAKNMGIAYAERDLFLDNELSEEAIRLQIRKLIKVAKVKGSAIGICHPHQETYAALKKEAPGFAAAGVSVVSVSALLHRL